MPAKKAVKKTKRTYRKMCPKCGEVQVSGGRVGTCPECGTAFPPKAAPASGSVGATTSPDDTTVRQLRILEAAGIKFSAQKVWKNGGWETEIVIDGGNKLDWLLDEPSRLDDGQAYLDVNGSQATVTMNLATATRLAK